MKNNTKILLVLLGLVSASELFAQNARYKKDNRYYRSYRSHYYSPVRASVSVIAHAPFGAVSINFGNRYYRYHNGFYYRPYQRGFMIVPPPIGIIVPVLPPASVYVVIGGRPYYRCRDIYYSPLASRGYRVVDQPRYEEEEDKVVAKNESSADTYEKFILEGKTYYKKGNKYYKAKVNDEGEIIYDEVGEVAKSN